MFRGPDITVPAGCRLAGRKTPRNLLLSVTLELCQSVFFLFVSFASAAETLALSILLLSKNHHGDLIRPREEGLSRSRERGWGERGGEREECKREEGERERGREGRESGAGSEREGGEREGRREREG